MRIGRLQLRKSFLTVRAMSSETDKDFKGIIDSSTLREFSLEILLSTGTARVKPNAFTIITKDKEVGA